MNKIIKNNTATMDLETGNFEDLPGKDMVNEPQHYKLDGLNIETKDVIKSVLGEDGYKNFCHGNILKYVMRANKKNGRQDFEKARVYLDWLISEVEE